LLKIFYWLTFWGVFLSYGCEFIHRYKCVWFLVPEPDHEQYVDLAKGWVSVCIRNYEINKQKCYLKAKMDLAEKVNGKPFKFSDVEISEDSFPREVVSIKLCKGY